MIDLFSDIFTYRENALTGLDPRTKLFAALCAILTVVLSREFAYPLAVCVLCMAFLWRLRVPRKLIVLRLLVPLGVVSVLALLKLFMTGGETLFRVSLGDVSITATREGLQCGLTIGARVIGAVSLLILLSTTTPAHQICRVLLWMKAPREWVEVAMLMYRYIFVLLETASNMATAQRLRLGYCGTGRWLHSAGILAGAVILGSVNQAASANEAMTLRGSTGAIPVGPMPPFSKLNMAEAISACGFFLGLFFLLEGR